MAVYTYIRIRQIQRRFAYPIHGPNPLLPFEDLELGKLLLAVRLARHWVTHSAVKCDPTHISVNISVEFGANDERVERTLNGRLELEKNPLWGLGKLSLVLVGDGWVEIYGGGKE